MAQWRRTPTQDPSSNDPCLFCRRSDLAGGRPVFVADQATHFHVPPPALGPGCGAFRNSTGRWAGCARDEAEAGELYAEYLALLAQHPARPKQNCGPMGY